MSFILLVAPVVNHWSNLRLVQCRWSWPEVKLLRAAFFFQRILGIDQLGLRQRDPVSACAAMHPNDAPQQPGSSGVWTPKRGNCGPGFPAPSNPQVLHGDPSLLRTPTFGDVVHHYNPQFIGRDNVTNMYVSPCSKPGTCESDGTPRTSHAIPNRSPPDSGKSQPMIVKGIVIENFNDEAFMTPTNPTTKSETDSDSMPLGSLGNSGVKHGPMQLSQDFSLTPVALAFSPHSKDSEDDVSTVGSPHVMQTKEPHSPPPKHEPAPPTKRRKTSQSTLEYVFNKAKPASSTPSSGSAGTSSAGWKAKTMLDFFGFRGWVAGLLTELLTSDSAYGWVLCVSTDGSIQFLPLVST